MLKILMEIQRRDTLKFEKKNTRISRKERAGVTKETGKISGNSMRCHGNIDRNHRGITLISKTQGGGYNFFLW